MMTPPEMDPPKNEDKLSTDEFISFCSPRYYRLLFPELKPHTKNGDLLSAMNELIHMGILSRNSTWDEMILTKKGRTYKKLIKKLMKLNELQTEYSNGLFDYRSTIGRKVIVDLIVFLAKKYNFNDYFLSLKLPVFEENLEKELVKEFQKYAEDKESSIDLTSERGQELLINFLKEKRSFKEKRRSRVIQKTLFHSEKTYTLSLSFVRRFIQEHGMNRPTPLIKHLVGLGSGIFHKKGKDIEVNFSKLYEIFELLQEGIYDLQKDESLWLKEYFQLLQVPASLFGFEFSNEESFASKTDAFLNVAVEGPKILATQFADIEDLGVLKIIIFPITNTESMIISIRDFDLTYYFTIPTENCELNVGINFKGLEEFPEFYRTSMKRFGRLLSYSETFEQLGWRYEEESLKEEIDDYKEKLKNTEDRVEKARLKNLIKIKRDELKEKKKVWDEKQQELENRLDIYSHYSAALFTTCSIIAKKISPDFQMNKCLAIYEHGMISFSYMISNDTLLTHIVKGKVSYGKELNKVLTQIRESMQEILNISEES